MPRAQAQRQEPSQPSDRTWQARVRDRAAPRSRTAKRYRLTMAPSLPGSCLRVDQTKGGWCQRRQCDFTADCAVTDNMRVAAAPDGIGWIRAYSAFSGARQREVLAGGDVCVVDMSLNSVHVRDKRSKNGNDKRVRLGPRRRHRSREPVHDSRLSAPNGRCGRFKSAPEYRRYAGDRVGIERGRHHG